MTVPLSALLTADLGVRLLAGDAATEVAWAHSSDLADPSPFLEAGNLLLTTGTQFAGATAEADYEAYVHRLQAVGVAALGFGTEVVRNTPQELVAVCGRRGLPLIEVPYRTPFIALSRRIADRVAAAEHARDLWALDAQRALSLAALSGERIAAVLHELARRLDATVLLFDSRADPLATHGPTVQGLDEIGNEARRMLQRGLRAASVLQVKTSGVRHAILHTLGRRDELRGVLVVVGEVRPDAAATAVTTAAVALAEFAVEDAARTRSAALVLNDQLLALALAGRIEAVETVLSVSGRRLPRAPLRLLVTAGVAVDAAGELEHDLVVRAAAVGEHILLARFEGALVAITEAAAAASAAPLIVTRTAPVVITREGGWPQLRVLIDDARRALARAGADDTIIDRAGGTVLNLLDRAELAPLARQRLAVIDEHPDGARVRQALVVWLRHNAAWEPAARELGIHRHTLKGIVRHAGHMMDLNLDEFAGKAELWALLSAAG